MTLNHLSLKVTENQTAKHSIQCVSENQSSKQSATFSWHSHCTANQNIAKILSTTVMRYLSACFININLLLLIHPVCCVIVVSVQWLYTECIFARILLLYSYYQYEVAHPITVVQDCVSCTPVASLTYTDLPDYWHSSRLRVWSSPSALVYW